VTVSLFYVFNVMSQSGGQHGAITAAWIDTVSLVQKCQMSRISV